jgi:membrane-bound metal-dependent hydrolase YbcI (DUF457 family)
MTTFEHAMLGVTGTLAAGLHRRYGWQIVALGGLVAVLPDWDGLSILCGAAVFDRVHRTLGHNLPICILLGAVVAALDYRYSLIARAREFVGRWLRLFASKGASPIRSEFCFRELSVWIVVGVLASLGHLAVDLVFSGHEVLSDWGLRLLWPFSNHVWAYPLVFWGDPTVALIFAASMFAMVRWPSRLQTTAAVTLCLVLGYIGVRGMIS